jgi:hypothetical protein
MSFGALIWNILNKNKKGAATMAVNLCWKCVFKLEAVVMINVSNRLVKVSWRAVQLKYTLSLTPERLELHSTR